MLLSLKKNASVDRNVVFIMIISSTCLSSSILKTIDYVLGCFELGKGGSDLLEFKKITLDYS